MVRWTDRPAMTIAVDLGRKATKQTNKQTFIKLNRLRYDSLSQKYQDTSVQALIAFNGIVFLLVKL